MSNSASTLFRRLGPRLKALALAWFMGAASLGQAFAAEPVTLWPTIAFIRALDMCQFEDAYGRTRSAQMQDLASEVKSLLMEGASPLDALTVVATLDSLIDKSRRLAAAGMGMDVTLEANVKASIDQLYREIRVPNRLLAFYNPASLIELLQDVREEKRRGTLNPRQLAKISGMAWGTYGYAPGCRGDVRLTLHLEMRTGQTHSFSAQGSPTQASGLIAAQIFRFYQSTRLPSEVKLGGKALTIVGTPAGNVSHTPSITVAEKTCLSLQARLPTADEYEQIAVLGEWNGGINLNQDVWALAGGLVYATALQNPSPVRSPQEVVGQDLHFYCVR